MAQVKRTPEHQPTQLHHLVEFGPRPNSLYIVHLSRQPVLWTLDGTAAAIGRSNAPKVVCCSIVHALTDYYNWLELALSVWIRAFNVFFLGTTSSNLISQRNIRSFKKNYTDDGVGFKSRKVHHTQTLHGTAIYADQLGWFRWANVGMAYMECLG